MTPEPLTHLLSRLPQADPDRAARVRVRCHAALARRQPRPTPPPRRLESFCVIGLCIAYLITVIQQALQ